MTLPKECSWGNCRRLVQASGLCSMHYSRQRNGKDMDATPKPMPPLNGPFCVAKGCAFPPHRKRGHKGMCSAHYERWRTGREIEAPIKRRVMDKVVVPCRVSGCDRDRLSSRTGLCNAHHTRKVSHGWKEEDLDRPFRGDSLAVQRNKALQRKLLAAHEKIAELEAKIRAPNKVICIAALEVEEPPPIRITPSFERYSDRLKAGLVEKPAKSSERPCSGCGNSFQPTKTRRVLCGYCFRNKDDGSDGE